MKQENHRSFSSRWFLQYICSETSTCVYLWINHTPSHTHTLSLPHTHTLLCRITTDLCVCVWGMISLTNNICVRRNICFNSTITHTPSHAHTHFHSLSLSYTHTLSLSLTHTHTHSLALTHTHTHTHTHSLSHSLTDTDTDAHTDPHTHTHKHSLSLSLTHTHGSSGAQLLPVTCLLFVVGCWPWLRHIIGSCSSLSFPARVQQNRAQISLNASLKHQI